MKKRIWLIVLYVMLCSTIAFSIYFGIAENPHFSINEFCMGLASELVGMLFAVLVVDSYIRLRTERAEERKRQRDISKHSALASSGFEAVGGESSGVKSVSVIQDKQTGLHYLFVVHETGSALTPLLDQDGNPASNPTLGGQSEE